jgi:hypothetical protein
LENPFKNAWIKILKKSGLSNENALKTWFMRTSLLKYWEPGISGGTDYYLSENDTRYFKEIINTRCQEINCLDLKEAIQLTFSIKSKESRK